MVEPNKSRRARGEITRIKILEAALRLIETQGHRSVTHRSVAAEAGVNLSLTTYYFKDLKQLISEAFGYYNDRVERDLEETWREVNRYLDTVSLDTAEQRVQVKNWLAELAADYIVDQVLNRASGLVLEMTFFYDLHLDPDLRRTATALRARFESDFLHLVQRLNSDAPAVDAALLLGAVQRLEYQGLIDNTIDRDSVRAQIDRLLSCVLKIGL